MLSTFLLPALVAILVFLGCLAVLHLATRGRMGEHAQRILSSASAEARNEAEEYAITSLQAETGRSAMGHFITLALKLFGVDTKAYCTTHQAKFYQAGLRSPDAPLYYLFFSRVAAVFFLFAAYNIATKIDADMMDYMEAGILAGLGVLGGPGIIKNYREKRAQTLTRSFPDALDLLLVCVEAGLALDGALLRVCKELGRAHPEIAFELNRTRLELSLLNDRTQALNNFAERNGLPAFRAFVTVLLQSEKFGTSLTDTLRVLSEDYRNQRLMKAEEKAGRLPALITIPLIFFLLPALFLIILGPAVITVIHTLSSK